MTNQPINPQHRDDVKALIEEFELKPVAVSSFTYPPPVDLFEVEREMLSFDWDSYFDRLHVRRMFDLPSNVYVQGELFEDMSPERPYLIKFKDIRNGSFVSDVFSASNHRQAILIARGVYPVSLYRLYSIAIIF